MNSADCSAAWVHEELIGGNVIAAISELPREGVYAPSGTCWRGPLLPCAELSYYRLTFLAQGAGSACWAVFAYDRDGNAFVADCYSSVDPAPNWAECEHHVRMPVGAVMVRCQFQSSEGELTVREVSLVQSEPGEALRWMERLVTELPPLPELLEGVDPTCLSRWAALLKRGSAPRVVMLGDSIVNDTNNSLFELLVGRVAGGCVPVVLPSVRGGTGCWHYRDPEEHRAYVAELAPDVLLIGGISHRGDADAVREVVRMTRAVCDCDIALMSGPMGADWRVPETCTEGPSPVPDEHDQVRFGQVLRGLAAEEGVAYFDMATPWNRYLGASLRPWGSFHRDRVHANDRGKQVLGRMLAAYLTNCGD
ncbi:MAG: hypothetical protein HN742_04320 [Lentisphaerae bacterium]|jgi:hypothetical protein|nr:hypothetical protein [Lentisphaerota bacterium]MBT4822049.1 hypothetical protein [Lentisphaerota bacterium]MBT5609153.1 hypothetical protein [Lentisphaerota bacterium]MBT7054167.1 hypothetical protein [Lentisphaerota bacterium]MBT7841069.1 hypothetical protein [Lentisphaerota bacterium]